MPERLQDWVSEAARRRPQATAVVLDEQRLSYAELDDLSARLAAALAAHGCAPGDRVALLMPKNPLAIACIVGVYKAGCVLVPLDPASPPPRLAAVVRSATPRWILAAGAVDAASQGLRDAGVDTPLAWLDPVAPVSADDRLTYRDVVAAEPMAPRPADGDAAAHILFTSGSTGTPKGVVVTHGNVIAFVEWAVAHYGLADDERLSCHSPLAFDLSVFDIFGAFAVGAELHLVPDRCRLLPQELVRWMKASGLTQWFSVPSVFNYVTKFDALRPGALPRLRRVLWCGEVLPTPSLIYWMQRLPHAHFANLYGPTEATIASSHHTVTEAPSDPTAEIPIGRPCAGEDLLVLDADGEPTAPGETGDLYITGAGLSPGYWNDPAATAAAFTVDPRTGTRRYRTGDCARRDADGVVWFAGRKDTQIKSRGYRIELGEIEAALATIDRLRESAVVAVPSGGFDGLAICCSYVPAAGAAAGVAQLRTELGRRLPAYMIPSRWRAYDALPRNATGKVDRRRLKEDWLDDALDTAQEKA